MANSIKQVQDERTLLSKIWNKFEYALINGHDKYTRRAQYLENMYLGAGRQWDQDAGVAEELENAGKPVLELNLIGADIRRLLGYQTQSRMNIAYEPRGEGDQKISEILTKIALFELDQNQFPWVESQVFEDGIVQQRGYFDIRMDYDEDIKGRIKITAKDPLDVIPDPDAKSYNPKDWNEVTTTSWIPLEELKAKYPKKYKAVKLSMSASEDDWGHGPTEGAYRNTFSEPHLRFNYLKIDEDNFYVRLLDKQYYKVVTRDFFYSVLDDSLIPVPEDLNSRQAKQYAKKMGYEIIPRQVKRIRWTVCTKDVILHDDWSPYDFFTIVPFFPVFRRGVTQGLVDNLISNQETINKAHSQFQHIINTTANSGWITQENSLVNMDDEELEQEGAATGLHIVYKRGYEKPEKIQPNQIPTGLHEFLNLSISIHDRLLGVSEAFRGDKSNEISGAALQSRIRQTATGLAPVIDNLFFTRNILAKCLLSLIQNFYTEERTLRIVVDKTTGQTEDITINQQDISGIINDITVGKYDVVISDVPTTINYQQGQLTEALEFRKMGVAIPDDEMVKLSTLARKNEIAKRLSGEADQAKQQQQQLMISQLESEIELLKNKAENQEQDSFVKAAQVAQMIAENPSVAPILKEILSMSKMEDQQEMQQQQPQQQMMQQQGLGNYPANSQPLMR